MTSCLHLRTLNYDMHVVLRFWSSMVTGLAWVLMTIVITVCTNQTIIIELVAHLAFWTLMVTAVFLVIL